MRDTGGDEMPKKGKRKEPNWRKIETEYITTDISQRKLAEKYGVSYNTIKKKSTVGGWVEKKNEHHRNVTAKARDSIADAQARDLTSLIDCVDKHLEVLKKIYDDEEQFNLHLVEVETEDCKTVEEKKFRKVDTKAMRDCVQQMEKLLNMYRDMHELPNLAQRLAAEKLQKEQETKSIEVVFSAGPEAWNE
jgi:uncharacterized protein YjcR